MLKKILCGWLFLVISFLMIGSVIAGEESQNLAEKEEYPVVWLKEYGGQGTIYSEFAIYENKIAKFQTINSHSRFNPAAQIGLFSMSLEQEEFSDIIYDLEVKFPRDVEDHKAKIVPGTIVIEIGMKNDEAAKRIKYFAPDFGLPEEVKLFVQTIQKLVSAEIIKHKAAVMTIKVSNVYWSNDILKIEFSIGNTGNQSIAFANPCEVLGLITISVFYNGKSKETFKIAPKDIENKGDGPSLSETVTVLPVEKSTTYIINVDMNRVGFNALQVKYGYYTPLKSPKGILFIRGSLVSEIFEVQD